MTLRSPVSGIVAAKNIEVGDTVQPGQTAFVIDTQVYEIVFPVSVDQLGDVHDGQQVTMTVPGITSTLHATIFRVDPTPIQNNGDSYEVEAIVNQPPANLKNGMTGQVTISLGEVKSQFVIPSIAIQSWNGQEGVFVYRPNAQSSEANAQSSGLPPHVEFVPVSYTPVNGYQDVVTGESSVRREDRSRRGSVLSWTKWTGR